MAKTLRSAGLCALASFLIGRRGDRASGQSNLNPAADTNKVKAKTKIQTKMSIGKAPTSGKESQGDDLRSKARPNNEEKSANNMDHGKVSSANTKGKNRFDHAPRR